MSIEVKPCSSCRRYLDINDFYNNRVNVDGKSYSCKLCMDGYTTSSSSRTPEYYKQNALKAKERRKVGTLSI